MRPRRFSRAAWLAAFLAASCVHRPPAPPPSPAPATAPGGGVHVLGDCNPTLGAQGNALHVGQYCTKHGHQCEANPKGTATGCATDLDKRGGNYCVKVFCSKDSDCGEAACCVGNFIAKACVPAGCFKNGGMCPK